MSSDYRELLAEFNAQSVEFLVVGAHAVAAYGHVRATKDLDLWIRPTPENAVRAIRAIQAFGAPLLDLTVDDLCTPGIVFQIGVEPLRIDILTAIDGIEFAEAWAGRTPVSFEGEDVYVLSRRDLIVNKRSSGRLQDLADVERLESFEQDEST